MVDQVAALPEEAAATDRTLRGQTVKWVKFNIGDWLASAQTLSVLQEGALVRLLMLHLGTKCALTSNLRKLHRDVKVRTRAEREAVDFVLKRFFHLTEEGWVNERVLRDLKEDAERTKTNRDNGKKGGRPPKQKTQSVSENDDFESADKKPTGFPVGDNPENRIGFEKETEGFPTRTRTRKPTREPQPFCSDPQPRSGGDSDDAKDLLAGDRSSDAVPRGDGVRSATAPPMHAIPPTRARREDGPA